MQASRRRTGRTTGSPSALALVVCLASCQHGPAAGQAADRLPIRQSGNGGTITCGPVDHEGRSWFGVPGEGAARFDGKAFTILSTADGLPEGAQVSAIAVEKSGDVLLGTTKGIYRHAGGKISPYPVPDTLAITCMLVDVGGDLWFATKAHGVFHRQAGRLINLLPPHAGWYNLGASDQLILDMIQDRKGHIWMASWNGGGLWEYDGDTLINHLPDAGYYQAHEDKRYTTGNPAPWRPPDRPVGNVGTTLPDDMIYALAEDGQGGIWLATRDHGVCRFDGRSFTTYGSAQGLGSRKATALLVDPHGLLWIGTADSGVWRYDGQAFKQYAEADGLVDNAVMSMAADGQGHLWFGTKRLGLSRFDGEHFTTFSRQDP